MKTRRILANILGTPIRFTISEALGVLCVYCVGSIIYHDQLGPLLCYCIDRDTNGNISFVYFYATSEQTEVKQNQHDLAKLKYEQNISLGTEEQDGQASAHNEGV